MLPSGVIARQVPKEQGHERHGKWLKTQVNKNVGTARSSVPENVDLDVFVEPSP